MKFTKPKRKTFRKRSTVKKLHTVPPLIKQYVKKEIAKDIENKSVQLTISTASGSFGSIASSSSMNVFPIVPYTGYFTMSQGITSNTRIGNSIRPKIVTLNYIITPNGYNVTTNPFPLPCTVQFYIGYVKNASGQLPSAVDIASLYQSNASSIPPAGSNIDLVLPINRDYWVIKKAWTHKIGYSNNAGTGNNAAFQTFANNDYKLEVKRALSITKLYNKVMKFNDAPSTMQGQGLFIF